MIRMLKRLACLLRGHDWQRLDINPVSRRGGKTCRRCRKRYVWRWPEGMVVYGGSTIWLPGDEPELPATKAGSVERWRAAEQAAGRETR